MDIGFSHTSIASQAEGTQTMSKLVTTTTGHTVDLSDVHASAVQHKYDEVIVRYYRATVDVYLPGPEGSSYCHTATCTHNHGGKDVIDELDDCRARLARIIQSGRVPSWAKLS